MPTKSAANKERLVESVARKVFAKQLGERIGEARQAANMGYDELATLCEVSRQTVSTWLNGHTPPDVFSLARMAQRLHLSFDELLLGEDVAGYMWYEKFSREQAAETQLPDFGAPAVAGETGRHEDVLASLRAEFRSEIAAAAQASADAIEALRREIRAARPGRANSRSQDQSDQSATG